MLIHSLLRHRRNNHAVFSPLARLTCNATVVSVPTPMLRSVALLSILARAAGAPTRAPDDFSAAQAAIQRAESNLQQHEYSRAKLAAIEAKHDASVALAQAQAQGAGGTAPNP